MTDTAPTPTPDEKLRLAEATKASLQLEPRLVQLLVAVHEAGHAIVAHTVGLPVTTAALGNYELIGLGGDHVLVDAKAYHDHLIPLPSLLAFWVAGFQASFLWLEGRGFDSAAEPYDGALNALASGDLNRCADACHELAPHAHAQDAIEIASRILLLRWRPTLCLAYDLIEARSMDSATLRPYLEADPYQGLKAISAYRDWGEKTASHWAPKVRQGDVR